MREYERGVDHPPYLQVTSDADLDRLQAEIGAWARMTFPTGTDASVLRHLAREVAELQASGDIEEAADCVILLLNWASRGHGSLWRAVLEKWAVVQTRQWGAPDSEGVIEHVRVAHP